MKKITQFSYGGLVYNPNKNAFALPRYANGFWAFPKGGADEGETPEQAAIREVREETGLVDVRLIEKLGFHERPRRHRDGSIDEGVIKNVTMWLMETSDDDLGTHLSEPDEISEVGWFSPSVVSDTLSLPGEKKFYDSVFPAICKKLNIEKNM